MQSGRNMRKIRSTAEQRNYRKGVFIMPIPIQHRLRRICAVFMALLLVAALSGCDQINSWLFSPPSSGSAAEMPSASTPEESTPAEGSPSAPTMPNQPVEMAPPYFAPFTPAVCRDAALAEVLQNNPLDRAMQKAFDGGTDIEQTVTQYADLWEEELGHAITLCLMAADDEQKALIQSAQETWALFANDEIRRREALAGAWGDSMRAKISSESYYGGPALHKLTLYRQRAFLMYETYYALESVRRNDTGEVPIQFLFDAD